MMKKDKLLVLDVGNTNITLGVFKGRKLLKNFRLTTGYSRTSDEYGMFIIQLLELKGFQMEEIEAVIIASVNPNVMYSLTNSFRKYFHLKPIVVGPGIRTGIKIATINPKELGADRIVDAVAAYEIYGGPIIAVDFGTATTFDLISEDGTFVAGVISPGIRTAANALWQGTAKLPEIEIKKPDTVLGRETITSMQSGVVYGYIGLTEYIIRKIKEESGLDDVKVVATGGLGKIIAEETPLIDHYDPMLTLKGLQILYEKQQEKPKKEDK